MRNEEYQIQVALVNRLAYEYPKLLFTIAPNGMRLPIGCAVKLKRMGYRAGTPDILIFQPNKTYNGLFIELKTLKGKVSPEQKTFLECLNINGYKAIVCRSADEAYNEIENYLRS